MTQIAEVHVSGNHAAMGKSPAASSGRLESSLAIWEIFRAGVRRRARREEMAAPQSIRIPKAERKGGDGKSVRGLWC
jgi:hypothetical protein